jgi:TRAP-type C4-dicarboxylate transport system permease small subunit
MQKRIEAAARALELALAIALIVAVLLNFGNVVGRYGLGRTMIYADEIQTYIMVYLAFIGAALASWRGVHLRMNVVAEHFPARLRALLLALESLLVLLLAALVTWVAWKYVAQMYALGVRSQTAQIPMWIPHGAIAIGFGLMAIVTVLRYCARR